MSRRATPALALTLTAVLGASACGTTGGMAAVVGPDRPLTIMADAAPHVALLREAQRQGLLGDVQLLIRPMPRNVDPNQLVASGTLDANLFQHGPDLKSWNANHGTDLQMAGTVDVRPLGLFSRKIRTLADIPEGARIAVPSDAVNQGRALFLLADTGLITLDVKSDDPTLDVATVTRRDITANPRRVSFVATDRSRLAASLDDPTVALVVLDGLAALNVGLKPDTRALALEPMKGNPYTYGVVTRPELAKDDRITTLVGALRDAALQQYVRDAYHGAVLPVWGAPTDAASVAPTPR